MNTKPIIKTNSARYKELDALRGIAACLVVFFHFTMGSEFANYGFKFGTTGVDLFFIISGFVIYMSLAKINSSVAFIINRLCRLYPTYWACVSFTFFIFFFIGIYKNSINASVYESFISYLGNMTMFQFYLNISDIDGPYWTLIIEMLFYLGILFLYHFGFLKHINAIGITLSILVVIITSFLHRFIIVDILLKWVPLLQFIPLFFSGIIFYKIYSEKASLFNNYFILLLTLVCQIFMFNYSGRSMTFINHTEYAIMMLIYFTLFILFVNHKLNFIVSKSTLF